MTNTNKAKQEQTQDEAKQVLTPDQEIAMLRAENEALKKAKARGISCKVGKAGGVSVYGLGRYPITLYLSQWENFLSQDNIEFVHKFIQDNRHLLKTKDQVQSDQTADDVSESA